MENGHAHRTRSLQQSPPPEDARPMCGAEPLAPQGAPPHGRCGREPPKGCPSRGILTACALSTTSTCSGPAFWQEELQAVAASRASQGPTDQPEGRSPGPPPGFHQVRSWPTGHGSPHRGSFTVPLAEHCGAFAPPGLPAPCTGSHACPRLFLWILRAFSSHTVPQTCLFMSFQINAQHTRRPRQRQDDGQPEASGEARAV